ncbi:ABC transporter permease [Acinetobacter gyllenbergii]|uniref:ABC transporter permease n=1 Tax=Acinetobacter gyllenbergii TaxID=134534 RepID=UPI0021D2D277|nr:ABC transporter permease [Acinetobacter gyllenbergii]MCU4582602.1 ABC transporter permease [Acinetobacter gyllenbergii]
MSSSKDTLTFPKTIQQRSIRSTQKPHSLWAELNLAWLSKLFKRSAAILLFLAVWEIVPRVGLVDSAFLPTFSTVLVSGWGLIQNGQLLTHVQASLIRSLSGFIFAILIAIPLGLAIGWYTRFSEFLNPLLEVFRNTAALALLPVFILFLGIGESSKIALVTYACTWPILLNTISGVRNVDPLLIKSARTMGLSPVQLFRKVILPAAIPTIFVGVRLAGSFSVLMLIAAEMVGAKAGLGYLINYAQYNFQIPEMFFGIISITSIGLLFNYSLLAIEKRLTAWKTER